jgi:hypothetical protein
MYPYKCDMIEGNVQVFLVLENRNQTRSIEGHERGLEANVFNIWFEFLLMCFTSFFVMSVCHAYMICIPCIVNL